MTVTKTTMIAGCAWAAMALGIPGLAAPSDTPALCKLAIVSPVSGYAECVDPPGAPVDPPPPRPAVVKLALFDFVLDDLSPAAAILGQKTTADAALAKASEAARLAFERSGHYLLVDVAEKPAPNCDGCEVVIAREAGAEQVVVGVIRRATQTDYYVSVQISDALTGKVLSQQSANFAGGPEGWASGVRMLMKHQVLATDENAAESHQ
jgi:Protein of unknown function (DUF2380)